MVFSLSMMKPQFDGFFIINEETAIDGFFIINDEVAN